MRISYTSCEGAGWSAGGVLNSGNARVDPVDALMGHTYARQNLAGNSCPTGTLGCGLSPRVRGNPPATAPTCKTRWSIPACAGEPYRDAGGSRGGRVYPRVCGGTALIPRVLDGQQGLSPRVRGNQSRRSRGSRSVRSIPACAGQPAGRRRSMGWVGDISARAGICA